jgi:putative acyl-CoA dehydrogenase
MEDAMTHPAMPVARPAPHVTHEVTNQVPALARDVADDPALVEALHREGAAWAQDGLGELGMRAGSLQTQELARLANEHNPVLRTHDARGSRIDEVEFHPAWHELMTAAVGYGLHAAPWLDDTPGAEVARAAGFYLWTQAEIGHTCPISMTHAAVPALRHEPGLAARFEPLLGSRRYDPGLRPPEGKAGLLAGMAMTEKQGGSDVQAGTTRAVPSGGAGEYLLTGHKWFCSAPMSDLFLVLAQAPEGLTCFLMPRVLPDGTRNPMRLQRLKDKLGNRSNASAEVEYDGAFAWRVGEPGQGVRTIIEMVNATRLDCVLSSAAQIRQACATAVYYAGERRAFGARLADQPLMTAVLIDLALEAEAATALAMRLAGAADRAARGDAGEAALLRLALPAAKFWVCKRAPVVTGEALECLGGNGYVEESGMPRLYRESPLNSVWEGSGNVTALDVLRALSRSPGSADALLAEADMAAGGNGQLDDAIAQLRRELKEAAAAGGAQAQYLARRLAGLITVTLQAALLVRHAPARVADAFCASRTQAGLPAGPGIPFGTVPSGAHRPGAQPAPGGEPALERAGAGLPR